MGRKLNWLFFILCNFLYLLHDNICGVIHRIILYAAIELYFTIIILCVLSNCRKQFMTNFQEKNQKVCLPLTNSISVCLHFLINIQSVFEKSYRLTATSKVRAWVFLCKWSYVRVWAICVHKMNMKSSFVFDTCDQ